MTRAGVYVRISQDRTGQAAGVRRQEQDCRELAARLGWDVVAVFTDNDVSASKGRRRPGFEALREALEAGTVEAVLAYHPDRLTRRLAELEGLVELIERTGAQVHTVNAGKWDLSTAAGRMTARVIGAAAQYEAETKGERQSRKALELAQAGRPNGGGPRPFGYAEDGVTLLEAEAEHIRAAAAGVLEGRGLAKIAGSWPPGPRGGRWDSRSVKRVLNSPRIAGLRSHRGALYPAAWPAILDRDTWEAVRAVLADPARQAKVGERTNSYLLSSGIARCGLCGFHLEGKPDNRKMRRYTCTKVRGGCGSIVIDADGLEAHVVRDVLTTAELAGLAPRAHNDQAARDLSGLESRIEALEHAHFVAGELSEGRYRALRAELEAKVQEASGAVRTEPARLVPDEGEWLTVISDWEAWWTEADLAQRRALLRQLLEAVTVGPAVRGRNFYDPGRTMLVWR